jgi:hypothetical protein
MNRWRQPAFQWMREQSIRCLCRAACAPL